MERREVALCFRFKYLLNAETCSEIARVKDLEPQFGVSFQERRFLWPWKKMLRLRRRDRVVRGLVNSTFASKYDIFYSDHEAWPEPSRPDIPCPWISKGRERLTTVPGSNIDLACELFKKGRRPAVVPDRMLCRHILALFDASR